VSELTTHLGSSITGGQSAVVLDYFTMLRQHFTRPLMQKDLDKDELSETVADVVERMNRYGISKEDLQETLWEMDLLGKFNEKSIETKVKTALTKMWNKNGKTFAEDTATIRAVRGVEPDGDNIDDDGVV
jgi:hypothetical protein